MNPKGNPDIAKIGAEKGGRPKGSKNKSVYLKSILTDIFSGFTDATIKRKLLRLMCRGDKEFFDIFKVAAKYQIDLLNLQRELFPNGPDDPESEEEMIARAEEQAGELSSFGGVRI